MEEWEKRVDGKSEEEDSSSTSPDTEDGTKKSGKERKSSYEDVETRVILLYLEQLPLSRRVKKPSMELK